MGSCIEENIMKRCGTFFLCSSVVALCIAYVAQYVFGLMPCKLCLFERIPYFVALIPALITICKGSKVSFFVIIASYTAGILLSVYHAGLEYGWFTDFFKCAGDLSAGTSFSDIKSSLLSGGPVVSCKVPSFVFLGLSLSGWNAAYFLVCIAVGLFCFKKARDSQD